MDIKAIVLVGGPSTALSKDARVEETAAGVPIAYLDVLGIPVLERVLRRLRDFGVTGTTVISDFHASEISFLRRAGFVRPDVQTVDATAENFWQLAEESFEACFEQRTDLVLLLRVGAYAEIDYEDLIRHHVDKGNSVTPASDQQGNLLGIFALNASAQTEAAGLFANRLTRLRREVEPYRVQGYVKRLLDASDLRRLAVDGLMKKNSIHPEGTEIKPGVWVRSPARIHKQARIIAPAYIGAHARIRASALITRGGVIEHHAEVDCGTVVEDSTLLPFSRVGAGLDVMHSVIGFRRLTHLLRKTEVEITDSKLVSMRALTPIFRLAGSAAAFFAFIPKQIYRGLFAPSHRKSAAELPESLEPATAALKSPVMEVSRDRS